MSVTALKKLVESSKATVLVAVEAIMAVMVFRGMMTVEQFLAATTVIVPAWFLAHAGETGAKALANRGGAADIASAILATRVDLSDEETPKEDGDDE